jgi:hypothetical protein
MREMNDRPKCVFNEVTIDFGSCIWRPFFLYFVLISLERKGMGLAGLSFIFFYSTFSFGSDMGVATVTVTVKRLLTREDEMK